MTASLPAIPFDYLPLSDAARTLGVAEHQLMHACGIGAVQLCVNIYGRANSTTRTRVDDGADGMEAEELAQLEKEERERIGDVDFERQETSRRAWFSRCKSAMPDGIFEIETDIARFLEDRNTYSVDLYEAYKFDGRGWWVVEFFNGETERGEPVTITRSDIVMMREELSRLLAPASVIEAPARDEKLDPRKRANLLRIIRALAVMAKADGRGAAGAIEKQLQELGLDGPKEATIRNVLKEAMESE